MSGVRAALVSLLTLGFVTACGGGTEVTEEEAQAPAPEEIVAAHSEGTLSRTQPIRVVFTSDTAPAEGRDQPLAKSPFFFDPPIDGEVRWTGDRELQFVAKDGLPPGTEVKVKVDLGRVKDDWKGQEFGFTFDVLRQGFRTEIVGLEAADAKGEVQKLSGAVKTTDVADPAAVEQVLTVAHPGSTPKIEWTHAEDGRTHRFVISDLKRSEKASEVVLSLDGKPIGVEETRAERVAMVGLGEFGVISARAVAEGDPSIELRFTDPLADKQDLRGLVTIAGKNDLRFDVNGSVLRITSASGFPSEVEIELRGLKNAAGRKLGNVTQTVSFAPLKPKVRFVGDGVIYPTSAGLTVPIEVVNVRSVMVEAMEVYEDNLPQFLQTNGLDGENDLHRVGKVVWRQRVPIAETPDRANRWVRLGLDVGPLVEQHPAGMYRLALTFDRGDIIWDCATPAPERGPERPIEEDWEKIGSGERSFWDGWEEGEDYPWTWYDSREDPCSRGYYHSYWDHNLAVSRNVIVSNLGLVAKRGEDGKLWTLATDLRSAQPMPQATIEVLDYQLQTLATGTTAADGTAILPVDTKPFVVKATAGDQHAWIKLDQGSALSTAHFDVSGAAVTEGLKGYFYGERGVWRPGDDIFLNFVLLDDTGRLPADHPIHFELRGPTGALVERRTVTAHTGGFWPLTTRTAADAPTGTYVARVQVGGRTFTQELRVESIVPNRLKIAMDFGTELLKGPDVKLDSVLSARWLHGAKAPNLETAIELDLSPRPTTFPKLADYTFDDPTGRFEFERQEIFRGTLDAEGKVDVDVPIYLPENAPSMLTASFTTRVFEPSGAASIDKISIPLSPHDRYLGVKMPKGDEARGMLLTDTKHPVEIVAVDADGKVGGTGTVDVRLYKLNWRWWWEKGDENLADFVSSKSARTLQTDSVQLVDGKATWNLEIKFPEWGRYLVTVEDQAGHRSGRIFYADWPGWAGRGQKDNPGGASVLSVTASDKKVEVGQPVTLNIPTSAGGRALVTLETGTEVLQSAWVEPTGETTTWTFTATPEMAPSIYANVTLVQPHLAAGNDRPIRLYGIVPIEVVDPGTKLEPKIVTADVLEPEATAKIKVSEGKGRPMTYTLAVVDEGLLGLTRFETPNPWKSFYKREALGVRTWDLYSKVAGAFGGSLEQMIAIGGDGEAADAPPAKANRFPPVVKVLGPFTLKPGETAEHEVTLPPYIGEVRVMVVAGEGKAFGAAEKSVPVKKDLMLLATLPRVLGPQEKLALPVSVFALGEKIKDVTVSVATEGPVKVASGATQKLKFSAPGDQMVSFPLEVADALGVAVVTVTAEGGGQKATHRVEIDVRHPGLPERRTLLASVKPGETWNSTIVPFGLKGTNEATLEVSRVPPLNLGKRLDYLIHYPHGCAEQTTSGAFPQVYLPKLVDLPSARVAEVQKNVRAGIERLKSFQTPDGGFAYWPGDRQVNDWTSSYVGNFLIEAERAGYVLPSGMRSRWVSAQRSRASRWTRSGDHSDLDQAYRLYTLALAGEPELGAMNRLKESTTLSTEARWRLAAAYQLAGQPEVAKALAAGLATDIPTYAELSGTFGSDLRDEAMILEAKILMADDTAGTLALATRVSEALAEERWMSTQTTAMSLVALARFAQVGGTSEDLKVDFALDGGAVTKLATRKAMVNTSLTEADGKSALSLTNQGAGPVFVRVVTTGLPPVGKEEALEKGISVDVEYVQAEPYRDLSPASLEHGLDFRAKVTIRNTSGRKLEELALTQIVPSGWEIHGTAPGPGPDWEYRDVRDDRVMTYFDLDAGKSVTFEWDLNASYLGRFWLPALSVEAMYDASIVAREPGQWVEVADSAGEG